MFGNGSQVGWNGDNYSPVYIMAYNRTGATVLKGQLAMADVLATQTETSGSVPFTGNPDGPFFNLTPMVQAADTEGQPCYVCDDVSIADNAKGRWVKCGECEMAILDDDVSTTDVDKGDRISILVSESAVAAQAWVTGGARTIGLALEDAAATSSTVARTIDASSHLRWAIFWGGVAGLGTTDT